jgi:hypothetical protein
MRKSVVLAGLAAMIVSSFILLQPDSRHYSDIMRELNRDVVYFADGSLANIWLWDDEGTVTIGESADGELIVFNKDEYKEIDQNKLLQYLNVLI